MREIAEISADMVMRLLFQPRFANECQRGDGFAIYGNFSLVIVTSVNVNRVRLVPFKSLKRLMELFTKL